MLIPRPLLRHVLRALAAGLALGFVAACGDPTGPAEPLTVSITPSTVFGPVLVGGDDPGIRCGFRFIASATGKGRADWQGAVFRFFAGTDRVTPVDTTVLTEDEILGAWSGDSISAARTDTSEWHFTAGVPFDIEIAFEYLQRGETELRHASARGRCGPVPSAANGPPTATLVQLGTSDPELNFGDTVAVTYQAQSANGLWRSGVSISGPFEATTWFADTLLPSASRTVRFIVPNSARLDVPLSVLLLADDIALERATLLHTTSTYVIDRAPPIAAAHAPATEFADGSLWEFSVSALDDNAIQRIVWELDGEIGYADTIVLTTPEQHPIRPVAIRVPAAWAGKSARLRVRAFDMAGQVSTDFVSSASYEFHASFSAPTDTVLISTWGETFLHAVDPIRGVAYGTMPTNDPGNETVWRVDLATKTPILPYIPFVGPGVLASTRSGDTLVVARRGTREIRLVSRATHAVLTTYRLSALDAIMGPTEYPHIEPDWIGVTANGHALIHLSFLRGVVDLDLATGSQRHRLEFERPDARLMAEPSADASRFVLLSGGCLSWYVVATDSVSACVPTPQFAGPGWIRFGASPDRISVGNRIVDQSLQAIGELGPAGQSLPDPDGIHHWTVGEGRILKVRTSDARIIKSMALPGAARAPRWAGAGKTLLLEAWGRLVLVHLDGF